MMASGDPLRLRAKLGRGSLLGRAIEAAQACGPDDLQRQTLERAVFACVGGAAAAACVGARAAEPHVAASAASWLSAGSTKLVLALVTAAALGGGAIAFWPPGAAPSRHKSATSTPAQVRTYRDSVPVVAPIPHLPTVASALPPPADSNPGLALALAEEHAQRLLTSPLDQERELMAVTPLVDLGLAVSPDKTLFVTGGAATGAAGTMVGFVFFPTSCVFGP
jgi:hypothetical protein